MVRVGKRALLQASKIEACWVENRPDAPTLSTDELEEIFQYLCEFLLERYRPTERTSSLKMEGDIAPALKLGDNSRRQARCQRGLGPSAG